METADNLNFRGKFKLYDVNGTPYLYRIGDSVTYEGKKYISIKATQTLIPGTIQGKSAWRELSSQTSFYFQTDTPISPAVGDEWFNPTTNIHFSFVEEGTNRFWVQLNFW